MFCKDTNCAVLVVFTVCRPNPRNFGETVASVAVAFSPVPKRIAVCGEVPVSLSATDNSPSANPAEVAVNVMLIVQLAAAANPPPTGHVVPEIAKVPPTLNDIVGLIAVKAVVVELLVSVTIKALLVVFTTVFGNCRNVGFSTRDLRRAGAAQRDVIRTGRKSSRYRQGRRSRTGSRRTEYHADHAVGSRGQRSAQLARRPLSHRKIARHWCP